MSEQQTYRVLHENYDDEGWEVEAYRAEGAAEAFAEHYDRDCDYPLSCDEDSSEVVTVVAPDGSRSRWRIRAYTTTNYSASEEST